MGYKSVDIHGSIRKYAIVSDSDDTYIDYFEDYEEAKKYYNGLKAEIDELTEKYGPSYETISFFSLIDEKVFE